VTRSAADPLTPLLELPAVGAAVTRSRAAVDGLLADRVLRRRSADVSAESALRGAWASAWLSGSRTELDTVRSGDAAGDPLVQGALRATGSVGALADTWTRAPRQALARLHALAAADLVDPDVLGRPRASAEVAARLDTLAGVLSATSAPALVVAAVVHGEILALDAFAPVSGIVARVAVRLTLVERGLDPKSLVVVEAGHREDAEGYAAAQAAYASGGVEDWIVHCCAAVVAGARESLAICEALVRG
jgi:hypothetical protein